MKKFFLEFWMLMFASLVIVSCSDDDASDDMSIVGKWQLVSVSPASMADDYDECEFEGYIEFASDGRYYDHRPCGVSEIGGGKWKLSNSTLTIISDILPVPMEAKIEIAGDRLVIIQNTFDIDDDYNPVEIELRETYKRVD
ncbi:unknown [Bacteroides sp. CAG:598]|nr:unknown [Bacteroides sp. CAG:598]